MQDKKRKDILSQALGSVILRLRKETKLSARSLACGMMMSKTTLLLAEKGKLDPQLSTFFSLADAFYVKPNDLVSMVMEELPENWFQSE